MVVLINYVLFGEKQLDDFSHFHIVLPIIICYPKNCIVLALPTFSVAVCILFIHSVLLLSSFNKDFYFHLFLLMPDWCNYYSND